MPNNKSWWRRAISVVYTGVTTALAGVASYFFLKTTQEEIAEENTMGEIASIVGWGLATGFFIQLAFNRLLVSRRFYLRKIRNKVNYYENKFLPYEFSVVAQTNAAFFSFKELQVIQAAYFSVRLGSVIGSATEEYSPKLLRYLCKKCFRQSIDAIGEGVEEVPCRIAIEGDRNNIPVHSTQRRDFQKYLSWGWLSFGVFSTACHTLSWTLSDRIEEESWRDCFFLQLSGYGFLSTGFFLGDVIENIMANDQQETKEAIGHLIFMLFVVPGDRFYHFLSQTLGGVITGWLHAYHQRTARIMLDKIEKQLDLLSPYMTAYPEFFSQLSPYLKRHDHQINVRRKGYLPLKWIVLVNAIITPLHFLVWPSEVAAVNVAVGYDVLFFYWLISRQRYSPYVPKNFNKLLRFFTAHLVTAGVTFSFGFKLYHLLVLEKGYGMMNHGAMMTMLLSSLPWGILGGFYLSFLVSGYEDELKPMDYSRYTALLDYLSSLREEEENAENFCLELFPLDFSSREIALILAHFDSYRATQGNRASFPEQEIEMSPVETGEEENSAMDILKEEGEEEKIQGEGSGRESIEKGVIETIEVEEIREEASPSPVVVIEKKNKSDVQSNIDIAALSQELSSSSQEGASDHDIALQEIERRGKGSGLNEDSIWSSSSRMTFFSRRGCKERNIEDGEAIHPYVQSIVTQRPAKINLIKEPVMKWNLPLKIFRAILVIGSVTRVFPIRLEDKQLELRF